MYAQFFGNYLLSKQAITTEQLLLAIEEQHIRHLKLGTLAMHAGLMTPSQVDFILIRQTHENKRFGELAVEEGFLTAEQVEELIQKQIPIYLLIGQGLVENGALSKEELDDLILSYQEENHLSQLENATAQQENLQALIQNLFLITFADIPTYLLKYLTLLFNNLIRFIGEDFMPLNPVMRQEYLSNRCSGQIINGEFSLTSYIDLEEDAAIAFASRYAGEDFSKYDEYVQASIDDFLNLHNGLVNVNVSSEDAMELQLDPPVSIENSLISSSSNIIHLPIIYPFGMLNFLIKL